MKTIREILENKPSRAVKAMCDGLEKQDKREGFVIYMATFGIADDEICFGCAATCAIQEIAGKDFTDKEIEHVYERAAFLGFIFADLEFFENTIDELRNGEVKPFGKYFDIEKMPTPERYLQCLHTDDWKKYLPAYRAYQKQLEEAGL